MYATRRDASRLASGKCHISPLRKMSDIASFLRTLPVGQQIVRFSPGEESLINSRRRTQRGAMCAIRLIQISPIFPEVGLTILPGEESLINSRILPVRAQPTEFARETTFPDFTWETNFRRVLPGQQNSLTLKKFRFRPGKESPNSAGHTWE